MEEPFYKKNKRKIKKKAKKKYEKNKEKIKEKAREKYEKDKKKILQRRRELYQERYKDYKKEYYLNHGEKIREDFKQEYNTPDSEKKKKMRDYYNKNKEHLNKKHKEYNYDKYHSDPQFRIKSNLRARLRFATLDDYGCGSMEPFLGCSIQEFRNHIESQFAPGMNWGNYGKWEFDHINAVVDFDLTNEEQIKLCYHYTNLRPMWSTKNRTKSKRV